MDTAPRPADSASAARLETEAERQRRLAWEAEMIAEADADIAAGRLIDSAKVKAWIDSIGTDHELPPPRSGRRLSLLRAMAIACVMIASIGGAMADSSTAKDFDFYEPGLQEWSKVIIKGVNKVARENSQCVRVDPATADLTDEGTASNPVFFVGCYDASGQYFTVKFSADDVKQDTTIHQILPISRSDALNACEKAAKSRAEHPSTVSFSRYLNATFRTFPDGRAHLETKFEARNSANLNLTFNAQCFFAGTRMTDVQIAESE